MPRNAMSIERIRKAVTAATTAAAVPEDLEGDAHDDQEPDDGLVNRPDAPWMDIDRQAMGKGRRILLRKARKPKNTPGQAHPTKPHLSWQQGPSGKYRWMRKRDAEPAKRKRKRKARSKRITDRTPSDAESQSMLSPAQIMERTAMTYDRSGVARVMRDHPVTESHLSGNYPLRGQRGTPSERVLAAIGDHIEHYFREGDTGSSAAFDVLADWMEDVPLERVARLPPMDERNIPAGTSVGDRMRSYNSRITTARARVKLAKQEPIRS